MAVELAPRTGLIGRPRSNGLDLPPDLTFEEWAGVVEHAEMIVDASPWWLADALAWGEQYFGERSSQVFPTAEEDPHGYRQSRLKQAAWMASKFPAVTRVPSLSYTHHRAVAELEPADRSALLREAVSERLSTRDLIARVKAHQEAVRAIDAASAPVCAAEWTPKLSDLEPEWRLRAERSGQPEGYLLALVDTRQDACFLPGRWLQ